MRADLQQRIAPTVQSQSQVFSEKKVESANGEAQDSTGQPDKIDFRSVLGNSNEEVKQKREAKKRGDYSAFKNQDEFLSELSQNTENRRTPKNNLDKDDFLKLFVTQLQHQDPMNPDDGAEMASKLAQFNSLEQMLNVNTTLNKMVDEQKTDRSLQMINYVGKEVGIDGGRLRLEDGRHDPATFDLKAPSERTLLQVRDANGLTIREINLGAMTGGEHEVQWDGLDKNGEKAASGVYSYFVTAMSKEGQEIPTSIKSRAKILGIDTKSDKGSIYTDFGKIALTDIATVGMNGFDDKKNAAVKTTKQAAANAAGVQDTAKEGEAPASGAAPAPSPTTPVVGASAENAAEEKPPQQRKPDAPATAAPTANAVAPTTSGTPTNEQLEKMRAMGQMQLPAAGSGA